MRLKLKSNKEEPAYIARPQKSLKIHIQYFGGKIYPITIVMNTPTLMEKNSYNFVLEKEENEFYIPIPTGIEEDYLINIFIYSRGRGIIKACALTYMKDIDMKIGLII